MNKEQLEQLVSKYSEAYHNGVSIVSDTVYDELIEQLRSIDPNNKLIKRVGAPIQRSTQWEVTSHNIHMGSLNKIINIQELNEWVSSHQNQLFIIEHKYDGISISLDYIDGIFSRAVTRGAGSEGENITANVIKMNFPKILNNKDTVSFRGEIILRKSEFKIINSILSINGEQEFKTPRNAASGIARNTSGKFCDRLDIVIYDCDKDFDTEHEKLIYLSNVTKQVIWFRACSVSEIEPLYNEFIASERDKLDYDIDGLVIKIDSIKYGQSLGMVDDRPKHQIALKFPSKTGITTVTDITWQAGRTGKVTPIAVIEPIVIEGRTIERASLHNIEQIHKLGIVIGSVVELSINNDVIPQIKEVIENKGHYIAPKEINGVELYKDGPNLYLKEETDDTVVKQIVHYVKSIGIENISEGTIQRLYDSGIVKAIPDLYTMNHNEVRSLDGFADKSTDYIFESIEKAKVVGIDEFIKGLTLDGFTQFNIDRVRQFCGNESIDSIITKTFKLPDELNEHFNQETIDKINGSLSDRKSLIVKLLEYVSFKKNGSKLAGMSFCITGSLSKERQLYINEIKDAGGSYKTSVSKGLTYLVTNNTSTGTVKNKKAIELGVKIIDEDTLVSLLGGKVETVKKATEELW